MSSGRVGKVIVLTCCFTAGYGRHWKLGVGFCSAGYCRHRSQWVKNTYEYITIIAKEPAKQRPSAGWGAENSGVGRVL